MVGLVYLGLPMLLGVYLRDFSCLTRESNVRTRGTAPTMTAFDARKTGRLSTCHFKWGSPLHRLALPYYAQLILPMALNTESLFLDVARALECADSYNDKT